MIAKKKKQVFPTKHKMKLQQALKAIDTLTTIIESKSSPLLATEDSDRSSLQIAQEQAEATHNKTPIVLGEGEPLIKEEEKKEDGSKRPIPLTKEEGEIIELKLSEVVNAGNFTKLQDFIFSADINEIASEDNAAFWQAFLGKFTELSQRGKIAENILDKISVYEASLIGKAINSNIAINHLKAETLLVKAENILNNLLQTPNPTIALSLAKQGINVTEQAYFVYQILANLYSSDKELFFSKVKQTNEVLYKTIEAVSNLDEQFCLFELALEERKANFPQNNIYLVDLFIKLGSYGVKLSTPEIKFKAMQYSEEAYNIIYEQKDLNEDLAAKLCAVLTNMKDLSIEFGDKGKGIILEKHINDLKQRFSLEQDNTQKEELECLPILSYGISSREILEIKKQIQANVLDKIQAAAAKGKWTEVKFMIEYGVSGYLSKGWLIGQLGTLASEDNYKIALALCFEAINIGITNSGNHNYTCAVIFSQKYPNIIAEIIQNRPQYFIDGSILRVSQINASEYSMTLIGQELQENKGGYNLYFEKEMTPIITSRIKDSILLPIKTMVRKGQWCQNIEEDLIYKLTNYFISPIIGNNLSQIPDVFPIVKITAFKTIVETITQSKSVNFSSVQSFAKTHPELLQRIIEDHEDLVTDETIRRCIDTELEKKLQQPVQQEEVPELTVVTDQLKSEVTVASATGSTIEQVDQLNQQQNSITKSSTEEVAIVGDQINYSS